MGDNTEPGRPRYTVAAHRIDRDAWHLTVNEIPDSWTVAFSADELESRARQQIALDANTDPDDFDLVVVRSRLT